jgi:hypothetical protein
LNLEACGSVKA